MTEITALKKLTNEITQKVEINVLNERIDKLMEMMHEIEHDFDGFRNTFEDLCDESRGKIKIPHRCPICNGTMYGDDGAYCDVCNGKGVLWG